MSSAYERVILTLLVESKVDTFARSISQKLMRAAKKSMDKINKQGALALNTTLSWPGFMKRKDYFSTMLGRMERQLKLGVPYDSKTINVKLLFALSKAGKEDDIGMSGSWSPAHDVLTLEVYVDSTTGVMKPVHLAMMQQKAYEVIRHELEHTTQTDEKLFGGSKAASEMMTVKSNIWQTPQAVRGYFMSEAETEAFVAGIYHKAKRTRQPFVKLVDQMINELINSGARKGVDIVKLRNIFMEIRYHWLEYAKKRFPKAVVQ
jgi:hypothetical protein